jgi:hypothetical protein
MKRRRFQIANGWHTTDEPRCSGRSQGNSGIKAVMLCEGPKAATITCSSLEESETGWGGRHTIHILGHGMA